MQQKESQIDRGIFVKPVFWYPSVIQYSVNERAVSSFQMFLEKI